MDVLFQSGLPAGKGAARYWKSWSVITTLFLVVIGVPAARSAFPVPPVKSTLQLTSAAFKAGELVPAQYTCSGKNISPPLKWTGTPPATKSFVLIVEDPDAPSGTFVHWVVYNLPPSSGELAEDATKTFPPPGKQGLNDFKHLSYDGPCPPPGKPHRYFFKLYALDVILDLKSGATKRDLETAMVRHVLGQAQLMGTYGRR